MKFLIVFALVLATVSAKDLFVRSIELPILESEGRITNGKNATPGQFKYQAGLSLKINTYFSWCGGSLIAKNWVLTAGHCAYRASSIKVYLGATQRTSADKAYNVSKSDFIIHPDFNVRGLKNDITLIRIPTTSESCRIGYVKIPSNNDYKYIDDSVVVAGWGLIDDNAKNLTDDLQYGILKVSPGSVCSEVYKSFYTDDTSICVATPDKVSTCYGDSGGALVLEGQTVQIGVLSYGHTDGCAKERPLAFTRVSAYLPWISSHTEIPY